jgi:beta-mannosidase
LVLFLYTGIGESSWAFKNIFDVTAEDIAAPNVDLVFEGVDTFAVITLVS